MATAASTKAENSVAPRGDKIVRRLDEFPELTKALREGDLATVRILCAELFELNSDTKSHPNPTPIAA